MKWQITSALLGLALALTSGCRSSYEDRERERREQEREMHEERQQDRREMGEERARDLANPVIDVVAGWEKLGERSVDGYNTDHDLIQVGPIEGRFSRLMLRVSGGDLVIQRCLIVFSDGEHYYPRVQLDFKEGSRAHEIDLPGKRLAINRVEFWYAKVDYRDSVNIELFGR